MTPKKKVLVLGASGFIGKNIFERLTQRPELDVHGTYFTHNPGHEKIYQADLLDIQTTNDLLEHFDYIVHAAAKTAGYIGMQNNATSFFADNRVINRNVIGAANAKGIKKLIFLSCTTLYPPYSGRALREEDFDEAMIHPKYREGALVKLEAESFCRKFVNTSSTCNIMLRHSNVYGPYDKFCSVGHAFPAILSQVAKANSGDEIIIAGHGNAERDFLAVSDLARCIEIILDTDRTNSDIYNVGSGDCISINELCVQIIRISGKKLKIRHDITLPSIDTRLRLNNTKILYEYGWRPTITLEDGIRYTLDWLTRERRGSHESTRV